MKYSASMDLCYEKFSEILMNMDIKVIINHLITNHCY